MEENVFVVASMGVGGLLTWMLLRASNRWSRGRGLLRVPERVQHENDERLWRAKADRAQGWRELWRSIMEFTVAVLVLALLGYFIVSVASF